MTKWPKLLIILSFRQVVNRPRKTWVYWTNSCWCSHFYLIQSNTLKSNVLGNYFCLRVIRLLFFTYPSSTNKSNFAESISTSVLFFCFLFFVFVVVVVFRPTLVWKLAATDSYDLLFIFFPFLISLSVARDTIVWVVKLQFLLASKVSFVFSFAKTTLSLCSNGICDACLQQSWPLAVAERFWLSCEV